MANTKERKPTNFKFSKTISGTVSIMYGEDMTDEEISEAIDDVLTSKDVIYNSIITVRKIHFEKN